jgi:hypothetical protein
VTESKKESVTRGKSTEARVERWIDSVGTVTLPLLAGFSITSVVVVSDDAGNFRWPGLTILVLTFAALVLLGLSSLRIMPDSTSLRTTLTTTRPGFGFGGHERFTIAAFLHCLPV